MTPQDSPTTYDVVAVKDGAIHLFQEDVSKGYADLLARNYGTGDDLYAVTPHGAYREGDRYGQPTRNAK